MDNAESDFLEDTTLTSFTSPMAASTAVRDAREDTFMKAHNFSGLLQNLFASRQTLLTEECIFDGKNSQTQDNQNSIGDSVYENSSLGLLSLDSINELSSSVISLESDKKMSDKQKGHQTANPNAKGKTLSLLGSKESKKEICDESIKKVQNLHEIQSDTISQELKQFDVDLDFNRSKETDDKTSESQTSRDNEFYRRIFCGSDNETKIMPTLQEKEKIELTEDTLAVQSVKLKQNGNDTHYVSRMQDIESQSSREQWAEKSSTPSCTSGENTLTSIGGTPFAPAMNSKYFRPPSHLSSDEKSASNFLGFNMSSSIGRESLPSILIDSKVSNEVEFRNDQITCRSSSFGTYGMIPKDIEQNRNKSSVSIKPGSNFSNNFDITDTASSSLNMNNLSSYLHSTKNNSQRNKHDVHKEPIATNFGDSNDNTIIDPSTENISGFKKKEDKAKMQTAFNEPSFMQTAANNDEFVTDLAFQTDFYNEIQNNAFTFGNDMSQAKFEEFFTTDEAAKMMLEDEKEFEKVHKFEGEPVGNQTFISIGSSWIPENQDITRPSWMANLNGSNCSHARISIGQFMRGKTEALGTLEGNDENGPTFGIDYLAAPREINTCHTSDNFSSKEDFNRGQQASTKMRSSETIILSSSENDNGPLSKSHSDSEKDSTSSLLSMSSISKLISEASVSEDPQAMAARFLENLNARKSKKKIAKKQGSTASSNFSKTQSTLQASQDSGVHSDLLKLSSDQETSSQSSSNNDKTPTNMQTVVRVRPVSKYERPTNSRKTLFSSDLNNGKLTNHKGTHNSNYHSIKTKLKKSSSTQALADCDKNDQMEVPTIRTIRATSDTDLSRTLKQHTESSSQTDTSKVFPSFKKSVNELTTKLTDNISSNTLRPESAMPCHFGSLPNLSSQTFQQVNSNQNAVKSCSTSTCEGSHGIKNFLANNIPASFPQSVCCTGIAPCSCHTSHVIGHHSITQNSSGSCPTSLSLPLVNPYVASLQPFPSITGISAMINNGPHPSHIPASCCHGILLEKKDKQSFAGSNTLQYDCEPIHQFSSNSATLQNTSLRKTVELNIADPICIGDTAQLTLVLQNPTSSPLLCNLKVNVSIDEQVLPAAVVSGFSFPHHLQIEAGGTRQVKILYTPRQSGHIAALLEVNADTSAPVFGYPLTAVINAEVEWPQVSLEIDEGHDFGATEECCTIRRLATVFNHSKVAVPIRLYISEDIQCPHSFSFGVQEINTEEHKNRVVWHFISPKVLVCQLPGKKISNCPTKLEIPLFFQTGKVKQGNNDEVSAIINATLESSVMCEALGCIKLCAIVGLVKLSVTSITQGALIFEAKPKCEVQKKIPLQNDGTVHCRINLGFKSNNSFQVFPSSIELNPKEEKIVQVIFYSEHKCIQENVLQATLENGNIHQLLVVRGECKNKRERKITVIRRNVKTSQTKESKSCQGFLTSNRSYLAWAGIDIGQSVEKKLVLCNNSTTESLFLKLSLKGNTSGIKFEQHLALNPELQLEPQEENAVKLIFSPTDACILNATLVVQTTQANNSDLQYTFPLVGYSGVSKIIIEGVNRRDDGSYYLNMCPPDCQNTALSHFTISNVGQRAGYVKVLCFTDYNLLEATSASIVTSQPSEFVLHPKETKTLIVACNHGNLIQSSILLSKQIAVLAVFFGDEILRQKLKRALKKADAEEYVPSDPLCNINFAVNYSGENKTSFDGSYPDSPRDVDIFYSNVSRYLICLDTPSENSVCDSTLDSIMSLTGLRDSISNIFESTLDKNLERNHAKDKYSNLSSPPVKGSSSQPCSSLENQLPSVSTTEVESHHYSCSISRSISDKENVLEIERSDKPAQWKIEPTLLNIGTEGKEGRICFTNLSGIDLRFKLQWSTNVLCVSPVQGVVSARSSIGLRVSPIASSPSINPKGNISGFIKVFCGGQQKEVLVKIQNCRLSSAQKKCVRNNLSKLNTSMTSQRESIQPISTKVFNALESSVHCPEEIKLNEAIAGDSSETTFQIRNSTTDIMEWNISPISDIFVQNEKDGSSKVAPSSTITMNQKSGLINAGGATDITAKFCPSIPGIHTQVWELNTGTSEQICIHISGESYNSAVPLSLDETPQTDISMQSRISNVTSCRGSFLQPLFPVTAMLKFPPTELKKTAMLKTKLKNVSDVNHKISTVKPSPPFFVKHSDVIVKSKHYLNLPVYFRPSQKGHSSGNLLIRSDLDYDINIHLIGEGTS